MMTNLFKTLWCFGTCDKETTHRETVLRCSTSVFVCQTCGEER